MEYKMIKKLLLFGVLVVLLVSCVSARFVFKNDETNPISISSIVVGFMEYKDYLKVEKCLDKEDKFILKDKDKEHPCVDKYFYLNSYFQVYNLIGGI